MKKTTSWTRELTNPITTHNPELHSFQFMCWPCNICNPESYRTYWSLAKQNCTNYTVQKRPPAIQTCKARHSLQKFVESVFLCRLKEHSGIGFYTVHCQNKQVAYVCIPLTWLLYIKGKTLWQPELLDFLKMIVVLLFGVCIVPVWAPRKKKKSFSASQVLLADFPISIWPRPSAATAASLAMERPGISQKKLRHVSNLAVVPQSVGREPHQSHW